MPLFLGALFTTAPDAFNYVPEIKVPKNLSDPAKIQAAKDAATEALAFTPGAGLVTKFTLIDGAGKILLSFEENGPSGDQRYHAAFPTPGLALIGYLKDVFPCFVRSSANPNAVGASIYGFNARTALRVASFEALRYGMDVPLSFYWWGRYQDDIAVCDPYDDIVTSETSKQIPRLDLMRYLHVPHASGLPTVRAAHDALALATKFKLG